LWSFDVGKMLTCNKLAEINLRRKNQQYISKESAIEINQTADKPELKDSSPFCRFFEYGANKDGYWNYHHAALQLEDVVDCLTCLFLDVDFVFLFDQSSGHGRRQKDGLSARLMNKGWGGASPIMHSSQIDDSCLGPYPKIVMVGDEQTMTFSETDAGPFYLSQEQHQQKKYDRATGKKKKRKLRKSEILTLLRTKLGSSSTLSSYKTIEELHVIANSNGISIESEDDEIVPGWLNKPKGLLQILWEHGWIDPSENLQNYVKEKNKVG